LVVGLALAGVLAVVVLVAGVIVLLRSVTPSGDVPPASTAQPGPGAVNAALLGVRPGDCVFTLSQLADPASEYGAQVLPCRSIGGYRVVREVRPGVELADVSEIAKSPSTYCGVDSDWNVLLIWASADGTVGSMICLI
jgi:hypothetical protein